MALILRQESAAGFVTKGTPLTNTEVDNNNIELYNLIMEQVSAMGDTMMGKLVFFTSTSTSASVNLPVGVSVGAPVSGDLWSTNSGIFYRQGTTTKQIAFTDTPVGTAQNSDLLDGFDSSYFLNATNINAGTLAPARLTGTYPISITGNSNTATSWASARSITLSGDLTGSVSIDGTANVTLNATIAANSVALGTDTTGNYAGTVAVSGNGLTVSGTAGEGTNYIVQSNATSGNTGSTLVFRDASGNFSAGTITASLNGNANTVSGFAASQSILGNHIAVRDGNGYIFGNYINMTDDGNPGGGTGITSFITKQGDNFYRSASTTAAANTIRGVASGTWGINISGTAANASSISAAVGGSYTWTGSQNFLGFGNTGTASQAGNLVAFGNSGGTNAAVMSFHRPGAYAINMGLDTDNVFRLGGWSDGGNIFRFTVDTAGNFSARTSVNAPNVNSTSDANLKYNIQTIENALETVCALRGVTFNWKSDDKASAGVVAQEIEEVIPSCVTDLDDHKVVNYNQIIGYLIESIKELKAEINQLKNK